MAPRLRHGASVAGTTAQAATSHFDREAATYESSPRYRRLAEPRTRAVDLLELTATDKLLDVGCGTGSTLRRVAPQLAHAAGVDISPKMIELARAEAREQPKLEFAVADSAQLPFPDGSFSAVLCTFSFHHYPRPAASAREIARVLEEGGRLVLADASSDQWGVRLADLVARRRESGHVRFYRSNELQRLLETAGFAEVAIHRPLGSWFMIAKAVRRASSSA